MTHRTDLMEEEKPVAPIRELTPREMARWSWRQLTSMRTALMLLLLLALAAVPGSLIPQQNLDSVKTTNWQSAHTTLTPIYNKLGLFDVYGSAWFSAVYILLMVSLIGCIVPRLLVYARAMRAQPPAAPRNLMRMPASTSYSTSESAAEVEARARAILRRKRYRVRRSSPAGEVASERGYLREAGNLVFHLSVIVVLVGFAVGSLFGYKGGVIVLKGDQYGFSNELTQYDDFDPGSLFRPSMLNWFNLHIHDFHVDWLTSGPRQGMARGFKSDLRYQTSPNGPVKDYDLEVNHPLDIGGTEVFLIGHGYAPKITVRDGEGNITYSGPQVFLPENQSFLSFGVVKPPTGQIALEGLFYPSELTLPNGQPVNVTGDIGDGSDAVLSLQVWKGDVAKANVGQSIYTLNTAGLTQVSAAGGKAFNLHEGDTATLPDHLGSVTFDGITRWNKLQISQTPFKHVALGGVVLALIGLLGSLFIRPRRVWVRARETPDGTLVEVAVLDRSGGDEVATVVTGLAAQLQGRAEEDA